MTVSLKDILARVDEANRAEGRKPLSDQALSKSTGMSKDLIRNWRDGKARLPFVDTIERLAEALGVTPAWLAYGEGQVSVARTIPLVSYVAASKFADTGQLPEPEDMEMVEVAGLQPGNHFALKVRGDSMDLVAPEDSLIVIDPKDRELVAKRFYVFSNGGGEATFKRYMNSPRRLEPMSTNKEHEAIELRPGIHAIGRVIQVIRNL